MRSHFDTCGAPICREAGGNIWYPEEEVCSIRPYEQWQKNQKKIQRLFQRGKLNVVSRPHYFNKAQLSRMERVRPGIRGKNPNIAIVPAYKRGKLVKGEPSQGSSGVKKS